MRIEILNPRRALARWIRSDDAVTGGEYAIMLALIVLVSMGAIGAIGQKFAVLYTIISGALPEGF